jgi:hypothetical protein
MQCSAAPAQHSVAEHSATQRSCQPACATDRRRLRKGGRETFLTGLLRFVCQSRASTHAQVARCACRSLCFRAGMLAEAGSVSVEERRECRVLMCAPESHCRCAKVMDSSQTDLSSQRLTERRQSKDMTSWYTIYMKLVR